MRDYLLKLSRQPPTWRGVVMLLTAAGVVLTPDQTAKVIAAGMAVAGAIGVFASDDTKG